MHLAPGTTVTTNTYFGRFHATYWQRWTAVPRGRGRRRDGHRHRPGAADGVGHQQGVAHRRRAATSQDADASTVRLVGPIDRFVDGGGMWLEITTETGELTVADVRWTVRHAAPGAAAPTSSSAPTTGSTTASNTLQPRCTATRRRWPPSRRCRWSTRAPTRWSPAPRFAEIAAALGERLRYVRQPNLGGAGGFTRGMFDATAGAGRASTPTCC